MRQLKNYTALLFTIVALGFSSAKAQTPAQEAEQSAQNIVMSNGDFNSGVGMICNCGTIDPNFAPTMLPLMVQVGSELNDIDAANKVLGDAEITALLAQAQPVYDALLLCMSGLCESSTIHGTPSQITAFVNQQRDRFQVLRSIATDIRGEIQKAKGKN